VRRRSSFCFFVVAPLAAGAAARARAYTQAANSLCSNTATATTLGK
jgi:hypothetical protein